MPTVDFGACLANYWFIWLINGLGSLFGMAINLAVSFFFLKYFHNMDTMKPPPVPKRSNSGFQSLTSHSAFSSSRA